MRNVVCGELMYKRVAIFVIRENNSNVIRTITVRIFYIQILLIEILMILLIK